MNRPVASRRVVLTAVAVTAGAGIGFGAYTFGSAAGADTMVFPSSASATTATMSPATPAAAATGSTRTSAGTPLTLDEAVAVAVRTAPPGHVGVVSEDHEPTGLRYDVTVLHDDGTSTDVEVDTVTGRVTDIDHDDDWD
jgi:hypothetical protein